MAKFGVEADKPKLDLAAMHGERRDAVKELTGGIEFLFKKNKVDLAQGPAPASSTRTRSRSATRRSPRRTWSSPPALRSRRCPGVEVDNAKGIVVDSTGALELAEVPKHMVVIGGGVIGLELGRVWRRLGAKVIVVEFLDELLPGMDGEVRKEARKLFAKQGMELRLSTKVTGVTVKGKKATLTLEPAGRRRGRDARSRLRAGLDRPPAEHRRPRPRRDRARRSTSAARSRPTTTSAPRSTACGRSAT